MNQAMPTVDVVDHEMLERNLTNHAPIDNSIVVRFEELRVQAKQYGHDIIDNCPPCRERSLALSFLEQSVMYAVAAIARNQGVLTTGTAQQIMEEEAERIQSMYEDASGVGPLSRGMPPVGPTGPSADPSGLPPSWVD